VIVLDRDLPGVHGDDVCRRLVAQGHDSRILMLTAEELLEKAWDEMADPFTTTVKSTIHRLRTKLGDPPVIRTSFT